MRRLYVFSAIALLSLLTLAGCFNQKTDNISESIDSAYKITQPLNKGELKIIYQKPLDDKTLVLASKYPGDGHILTNLFIIASDKSVEKMAGGVLGPLSQCFNANVIEYNNRTVVFGTFNASKWDPDTDTKKPVDIQNIVVKFKNGEIVKEKVGNGYIVYSTQESALENIELYNDNGQLQSELSDIGEADYTEFLNLAK